MISNTRKKEMDEMYSYLDQVNGKILSRNKRRIAAIQKVKGAAWVKQLDKLFNECEVGAGMLYSEYHIVRHSYGQYQNEKYGQIKGYWVEQWGVGDSGDSWEGNIYVEIVPGKYIKAPYTM